MKQRHRILFFLSFFLLLFASVSSAGQFRVNRVYDGDSIRASGHDIEIVVRLVGIDAPEISHNKGEPSQPYSQKAKKYLAGLILNKTIEIKGWGLDRYHRILGVIYLGEQNINLEMLKAGLAEVYRGLAPHKFKLIPYWREEKNARDAKKNMWSLGDKYLNPREWRKAQRQK